MAETCQNLHSQALVFLTRRTADWPRERIQAALRTPEARAADDAVNAAMLAHDFRACVSACRQWTKAILAYQPHPVETTV